MRDRTSDDLPAYPPVLEAALVARIHELNRDYIDLLVDRHTACDASACSPALPVPIVHSLALLNAQQRRAMARTSYSLYSLGFDNPAFWRTVAAHAETVPALSRYGCGASHSHGAFCEVALFHAWHSALSNPLAARVVYGMPDFVLQCLSATPPWRVKQIAADQSRMLMPRWPSNPRFWPDLVRFAANQDTHRLTAAQLLGNQLLAAELERAQRGVRGRGDTVF